MTGLLRVYSDYQRDPAFAQLRQHSAFVPGRGCAGGPVVVFVGEAPGAAEDRQRQPFVGPSGSILNRLLAEAGIREDDVFITNIVKYRPPRNRDPLPEEVQASLPYLMRELDVLECTLIVPLGRFAASCFGVKSISKEHGVLREWNGRLVLPCYHPATVLYGSTSQPIMMDAFRKMAELA